MIYKLARRAVSLYENGLSLFDRPKMTTKSVAGESVLRPSNVPQGLPETHRRWFGYATTSRPMSGTLEEHIVGRYRPLQLDLVAYPTRLYKASAVRIHCGLNMW